MQQCSRQTKITMYQITSNHLLDLALIVIYEVALQIRSLHNMKNKIQSLIYCICYKKANLCKLLEFIRQDWFGFSFKLLHSLC